MLHFKTLLPTNQATFNCPIFDATTRVAGCVLLRDKLYRGDHIETRKGCQACISASKCPMAAIVSKMAFGKSDVGDDMGDLEPRTARLPADILGAIMPIMVMDTTLTRFRVSDGERLLIATANIRIEKQLLTAPKTSKYPASYHRPTSASAIMTTPVAAKVTPAETAAQKAAATGDLSGAIN